MENILDEIFKAYDIRGKVGEQLNTEIIYEIGRAFSDWLPENGPVAVGYDMRPDSKDFTEALIRGIVGQGRDVWNLGMIATDMIYYAVGSNSLAGGAVVTASHNPGEYNGIKLCREDAKPIGENSGLFEIKDNVKKKQFTKVAKQGQVINKDITEGWIDFVISFIEIDKLIPLKLAVDAGNGMAGIIFAELEPFVPWEVTEMYFEPDGTFPNHEANPLKFETLKDLVKQIKENNLYGGIRKGEQVH
jgi:phosphomannomutase